MIYRESFNKDNSPTASSVCERLKFREFCWVCQVFQRNNSIGRNSTFHKGVCACTCVCVCVCVCVWDREKETETDTETYGLVLLWPKTNICVLNYSTLSLLPVLMGLNVTAYVPCTALVNTKMLNSANNY